MPIDSIGQIGGENGTRTGGVDIAVIQSLNRKGWVKDWVAEYGQVIADECHHLSAFTFEQVMRQVRVRYVVGLTATPRRKDGHDPIIEMQCGAIRYRMDPKVQAAASPFEHMVIPRRTSFSVDVATVDAGIQTVYAALARDATRNALIVADIVSAVSAGRTPLVLTARTDHLQTLADMLAARVRNVVTMKGGMGRKQREAVARELELIPEGEPRVIVATGRYVGEGFDDARLDTLFLAMPISWRGTLQQYVGRLHRRHDNKRIVQVYDYVDAQVPVLVRMFEKRLKGYGSIGYSVEDEATV